MKQLVGYILYTAVAAMLSFLAFEHGRRTGEMEMAARTQEFLTSEVHVTAQKKEADMKYAVTVCDEAGTCFILYNDRPVDISKKYTIQ